MKNCQRRAWRALGLGPSWASRGAVAPEAVAPEAVAPEAVAPEALAVPPRADGNPHEMDWNALRAEVLACQRCALAQGRTQTVFGIGDPSARWLLVGEAPGAEEDARGEPFVGQAGRLLDNMLAAIGLGRERDVFIANVLKCRPPRNRDPEPSEVRECEPFLRRQVDLLAPSVIVVMGRFAAQTLLQTDASIASLRGRVHRYRTGELDVPLVVTYHPAYLLRTPADKGRAWVDWCLARDAFARAPSIAA